MLKRLREMTRASAQWAGVRLKRKRLPLLADWRKLRTAESAVKEYLEVVRRVCPLGRHSLHNHSFRIICSYVSWDHTTHETIIDRIKREGPDAVESLQEWRRPLSAVVVFALRDSNYEIGLLSVLFDLSFLGDIDLILTESLLGDSRNILMDWPEHESSYWIAVEPILSEDREVV